MSSNNIAWHSIFDEVQLDPPATSRELEFFLQDLARPLSPEEVDTINRSQRNPWSVRDPFYSSWKPFDPTLWRLPGANLPPTYLSFLRWSRAPWVRKGARVLGHLGSPSMREYLLAYHFPQYLPGVLPLGLDGSGTFAAFDMRTSSPNDEHPVIAVEAGVLDFTCAVVIARSFLEFCTGTSAIEDQVRGHGAV